MSEREFWSQVRQALLMLVDAIERRCEIELTTAEMRKMIKAYLRP